MRLITTAIPYTDESLASYFVRLAELNHYDSPRWIFWLAGYSTSNNVLNANLFLKSINELDILSQATGVDAELLFSMAFYPDRRFKGAYTLSKGVSVPIYAVHKTSTKICPLCLTENEYIRKSWEISLTTVCTKHQCLLIDICPRCGRRISIFRKTVVKCICGFDLREAHTQEIRKTELGITKQIEELMVFNVLKDTRICSPSFSIKDMELYNFARLIYFTAAQMSRVCDTTGKFTAQANDNAKLHFRLLNAFDIYCNWPENFYKFLDKLQKSNGSTVGDTGVIKDFGSFYRGLFETFNEPDFEFVRLGFKDYLENRWQGGYIKRLKYLKPDVSSRKYITKSEAIRVLGVRDSSIDRYVKEGFLEGIVKKAGTRKLVLIKLSSANELKQNMKNGLSLRDTGYLLGIGHESVVDLVVRGHLSSLKSPSDGYAYWLICSDSIKRLIDMVKSRLCHDITDDQVSFHKAIRMLSSQSFTIADFLDMVQKNQIRPCVEVEEIGLHKYLFNAKDVENAILQRVNEKKGSLMTVEEAANRTRIKYEVLSQWIDRGFMQVEKVNEGRKRHRYITNESLDIFQKEYVTCSSLAKVYGISSSHLLKGFTRQGIYPISGPTIDGARQYLFRSSDVINPLF